MMVGGKRGRRPGRSDTKSKILDAARKEFAANGFEGFSMRQIAASAGVDSALVHHYFGTKDELFNATVQFPLSTSEIRSQIADGPLDEIGMRVARTFLSRWDDPVTGKALEALLRRALSSRQVSRLMQEFFSVQIVRQVGPLLEEKVEPSSIPKRASLTLSHLFGVAIARNLIGIQPIASMSTEDLVQTIAPALQHYLTGDIETAPNGGNVL